MGVIEIIRSDREDLARVLKKHSGIRRMVEDLYPDTAHFIYELLQNAEDTGASRCEFDLSEDGLLFEHDGRPFVKEDIEAITDIGEGTKAENDDKIGRFGIGFKAVFAYTETPHIWSGAHSFRIQDMVLPYAISDKPQGLGERTRFWFPFNSRKKHRDKACSEVESGLDEVSSSTLLFLSSIKDLQWRIGHARKGCLQRIEHSDHHIEIRRKIDGNPARSSHFLRFANRIEKLENQFASIVFELEPATEKHPQRKLPFFKRFRIVPAKRGCVAIYFTAAKETSNLRFHLHAPFVPELSRSSVKDSPANVPLFQKLADLASQSLCSIRDLGLLDREFLAVLPNSHDGIPDQYDPIREAIVNIMNEQSLTPNHSGGHSPSNQLVQGESGLKTLLDPADFHNMFEEDEIPQDWAVTATQRNSNIDRFLSDLDIYKCDIDDFADYLKNEFNAWNIMIWGIPEWIKRKPLKWYRSLYALLYQHYDQSLHHFKDLRIVRLSNGELQTGGNSFFPSRDIQDDTVDSVVAPHAYSRGGSKREQDSARKFLEGIGVQEVSEVHLVKTILDNNYTDPASVPPWNTYVSHLPRFIDLIDHIDSPSDFFKNYFILKNSDGEWCKPGDIYLDAPYLKTDLKHYYTPLGDKTIKKPLSSRYRETKRLKNFVEFARKCGAFTDIGIYKTTCSRNHECDHLLSAPGRQFTESGIDQDYHIPYLDELFMNPNFHLSRTVWDRLCNLSHDWTILEAVYQKNKSNTARRADSTLVHQLRNAQWIPQGDNQFVLPSQASEELLPDEFQFDRGWRWLDAIGFASESRKREEEYCKNLEIAEEAGFGTVEELEEAKKFSRLSPETRRRILAEHAGQIELPTSKSGNPKRRAITIRNQARNAPERIRDKRKRSVSVNRDGVKREKTNPYLRSLYTNEDGVTVCQICKDRLPFKVATGRYYFEAVEFLSALKKHHYQNYLVLCPNHAAMFVHANSSRDEMMERFLSMHDNRMELKLADASVTVYFTDTHIEDLEVIIEVDNQG